MRVISYSAFQRKGILTRIQTFGKPCHSWTFFTSISASRIIYLRFVFRSASSMNSSSSWGPSTGGRGAGTLVNLTMFFLFIFETFRSQRKLLQLRPAGSSQNGLPCANSAAARRFQVGEAFGCDERNCDHLCNYFCRSASGGNCFNCGQPGHRKIDCPSLASGESAGPSSGFRSSGSSGACFNCGQTGHRKADCPSAVAGGSRPPIVCFKCVIDSLGSLYLSRRSFRHRLHCQIQVQRDWPPKGRLSQLSIALI
jgi:hypothetical protein